MRAFRAGFQTVWRVVLRAVEDRGLAAAVADRRAGRIETRKQEVSDAALERIARLTPAQRREARGGWYTVTISVEVVAQRATRVSADVLIVASSPARDNVLGGFPVPSRNVVEEGLLDAVAREAARRGVMPLEK